MMQKAQWAITLGGIVSPSFPDEAIEAIKDMLPLLEFPDAAFTTESLKAVARSGRQQAIPSFDELERALSAWWRANRPTVRVVPGPPGQAPLSAGDASWLDTWHRHTAERFVNMGPVPRRTGIVPDTPEAHKRAHLSLMIRHFAPAAWARIAASESDGVSNGPSFVSLPSAKTPQTSG